MKLPILFLGLCALVGASCTTTKVGSKDEKEPMGIFSVKISPDPGNIKVYVTAYERDEKGNKGPNLADYQVGQDGVSGFVLPMGKVYGVKAYADLNGDKIQGGNEPSSSAEKLKPLPANGSGPEYEPTVITLALPAPAPGPGSTEKSGPNAIGGATPAFAMPEDPSKPSQKTPTTTPPAPTAPAPPESLPVPPPPPPSS